MQQIMWMPVPQITENITLAGAIPFFLPSMGSLLGPSC
jgi:hypothetical protein